MPKDQKDMPIEDELKLQVNQLVGEEKELSLLEHELMSSNPKLGEFLQRQKEFSVKQNSLFKAIEEQMIQHNIKSIKGYWGSLTIAEATRYSAADLDQVPPRFIKKALDTGKVAAEYKLKNKLPKGVESSQSLFLQKRIKLDAEPPQEEN